MQSKVSIMKRLIKVLNFSKNDQERKMKNTNCQLRIDRGNMTIFHIEI